MPPRTRSTTEYAAIRAEVATRSSTQAHVFTRVDLACWGVDPDVCRTMVSRRQWIRLRYGIYADASCVVGVDAHVRHVIDTAAASASLDQPAFAFGLTAAHVHGLPLPKMHAHIVHLVRGLGMDHRALRERLNRRCGMPDIRVTGHALERVTTTTVGGVLVVTRPLAALSAAACPPEEWAVVIMDAVCFDDARMPATLAAMVGDWPSLRGIGEADGAMKYDDGIAAVITEERREDRLRALGHGVVRWSWDDLFRRPEMVAGRIRRAAQLSRSRYTGLTG